jgi:hypothetical protein
MTSIYPNINQRTFIKALELFHKRDIISQKRQRNNSRKWNCFSKPMKECSGRSTYGLLFHSVHGDLLLLEIPTVFLINQHQIEIIFHTELVVDVPISRCQVIWAQK